MVVVTAIVVVIAMVVAVAMAVVVALVAVAAMVISQQIPTDQPNHPMVEATARISLMET